MAKTTSIYRPKGFRIAGKKLVYADIGNPVLLAAAGADDSIVKSIAIASDDASNRSVSLVLNDGTTDFIITTILIPAYAGTLNSVIPVDGLSAALLPLDDAGKKILLLQAGWNLKLLLGAITAAKTVTVTAHLEDF